MIGESYKKQLTAMHSQGLFNNGLAAYKIVKRFLARVHPESILDYGCGHGALIEVIRQRHPGVTVSGYDPGNSMFDIVPVAPSDVVLSTDVLEHVEPEHIDATLYAISVLIRKYGFFRIACYPARKLLPDGRNAHLIVEHPDWWREKILQTGQLQIVRERITKIDKRGRYEGVVGFNYDVVVKKNTFTEPSSLLHLLLKYGYPIV
jgi:2-polyprenyl-3-methyl-5-hydroxy-6-metoxy-1,4-benzoquinol methylase